MSIRALVAPLVIATLLVACTPGGASPTPQTTSATLPSDGAEAALEPAATAAPSATATPTATAAATASPTVAPTPPPTATPAPDAESDPQPFAMNLAKRADFVAQYTFEWCVGASLQMALNMATDEERTGRQDQADLWAMARDRSFSPFGGANPRGWTAALNDLGIGPYELVSVPDYDDALATAAEAIRSTKRPVGLVMWRGRHAWVMSGFESSADPRTTDTFEVTGIRVHDPLYPHGSSVWGKSPKPNSLVSPATLARQFVERDNDRSRVDLGVASGYLLILPVADAA